MWRTPSLEPIPPPTPTMRQPLVRSSRNALAFSDDRCSSRAGSISKVVLILLLGLGPAAAEPVGAAACRACHFEQYTSQSQTGHARALSRSGDIWNFGSGLQAVTPVSRIRPGLYKEHGLTRYTRTRREAITPGHVNAAGVPYPVYDPGAQILRCFQCHSTGPLRIDRTESIVPFEMGVRCETCHGAGGEHVRTPTRSNVDQPRMWNGERVNAFCGSCHRQPPKPGDDTDFANPWNTRHQPVSLSQSACFRKSQGRLTCFTCHAPHGERPTRADACADCHPSPRHAAPVARSMNCVNCHMPAVKPTADLEFANHWIGIYAPANPLFPRPPATPPQVQSNSGR